MRATASDLKRSQKREISSALLDLSFNSINLSCFISAKLLQDLFNWYIHMIGDQFVQ